MSSHSEICEYDKFVNNYKINVWNQIRQTQPVLSFREGLRWRCCATSCSKSCLPAQVALYWLGAKMLTECKCHFSFLLGINSVKLYGEKSCQVDILSNSPGIHLTLLNTTQKPAGRHSVKSNDLIRLMMCKSYIKDDTQGRAAFNICFFLSVMKQQLQTKHLSQDTDSSIRLKKQGSN